MKTYIKLALFSVFTLMLTTNVYANNFTINQNTASHVTVNFATSDEIVSASSTIGMDMVFLSGGEGNATFSAFSSSSGNFSGQVTGENAVGTTFTTSININVFDTNLPQPDFGGGFVPPPPPTPEPPAPPQPREPTILMVTPNQYVQMAAGVPQYVNVTIRNIVPANIARNVNIHLVPIPNFTVQIVDNPSPFSLANVNRTFTLRITPSSNIDAGSFNIPFELSYENNLRQISFIQKEIPAAISSVETPEARVVITNFTTGNVQLSAGDSFNISATLRNMSDVSASNVQLSISGLGGSELLLSDSGMQFVGTINGNSERIVSFGLSSYEGISTGSYPITLTLSYESGDDVLRESSTFYITIIGTDTDNYMGRISVTNLSRPTGSFVPNQEAVIEISIRNDGEEPATNVRIQADPDSGIVSRMASIQTLQRLEVGQTSSFTFAFSPTTAAQSRFYNIGFEISYDTTNNQRETFNQFTGFVVHNPDELDNISVPRIIISNYTINPLIVMANSEFDLYLTVQNTHSSRAVGNIRVTWEVHGITTGTEVTGGATFTPVDSSNTFFIDHIPPRGQVNHHMRLFAIPDAAARNHVISISFEYEDIEGNPFESTENIGVNVRQVSRLELGQIFIPEFANVGEMVQQNFTVFNTGRSTLHNLRVRIEGDGINATEADNIFGNVAGGEHDWFFGSFVPMEAGNIEVRVIASFEDDMGEPHEIMQTFHMLVDDPFAGIDLNGGDPFDGGDFGFWEEPLDGGATGGGTFSNPWFYAFTGTILLGCSYAAFYLIKNRNPSFLREADLETAATDEE